VQPLLVLWDVDYTLVATNGVGRELYEVVLAELYGLPMPAGLQSMAGRTDSSIALEVLAAAGLGDPARELRRFQDGLVARAPDFADRVRETGRVLPGVEAAIGALADFAQRHRDGYLVVQSLLTGNLPALAEVKLGSLGLTNHLDVSVGAYGDISELRADLVPVARENASRRYGADFSGHATVLIGDTPEDVGAAASAGARSVGVATGRFTMQQLIDAGAGVVLPDLTDTEAVLGAVLGYPPANAVAAADETPTNGAAG